MRKIGNPFLISLNYMGDVHDAVACGFQDERKKPFFRVTISNGQSIDLYWFTPKFEREVIWFDRETRKRSVLADKVGAAIEEFVSPNL